MPSPKTITDATSADARDWLDEHFADRYMRADDEFQGLTHGKGALETEEVIAITLIRIARALERLEVPVHIRTRADEIDPPPPPAATTP